MKNLIIAAVTATVISAAMPQAEARGSYKWGEYEKNICLSNCKNLSYKSTRTTGFNPRVTSPHGTGNAGYKWGTGTKPGRNAWGFSFSAPATGTTKSHAQQKR